MVSVMFDQSGEKNMTAEIINLSHNIQLIEQTGLVGFAIFSLSGESLLIIMGQNYCLVLASLIL